ncbi:glutathione S-transferase [Rubidibacter lacunae KORDI 51-2]|uniref:Glutathione S-transferase n=1 Tax=Rubidibacter lacunae KORDI 51-2 TaxID=582515 RepID=U5DI00_9CHRO|nr:glutathione S-transferase family protein [Rubidibacter lacunae]ERN40239.1 glutathione S-transferase [Rubidibacter lacunae KORDI 51-2]
MIELYQFELSQFSEKVRLILDFKGVDYHKVEVTPGVGQFELMQASGRRQVPVIKDGEIYVGDSTEIALYLERKYPEPALLPTEPYQRGLCLMMEEWADESIGLKARQAFLGAIAHNQNLRTAVLPDDTPDFVKTIVGAVPGELLDVLGAGVGASGDALKYATDGLRQDLEALCLMLQNRSYLIGDAVTLADLTVAALSITLKFPDRTYLDIPAGLAGKGVPGLGDDSAFAPFFEWRDRLYADFRKPLTASSGPSSSDGPPTSIEIE